MSVFELYEGANAFWVSSTKGNDTNPGTRTRPVATISKAHTLCTTSQGDVIVVMEHHTESLTTASELTIDKSELTIIGLGNEGSRGGVTVDADVAGILVSGSEITFRNIEFQAGFADIAKGMAITGSDVAFIGCHWRDAAADENFLTPIHLSSTTDNDSDGFAMVGCTWYSVDTAPLSFHSSSSSLKG